MANGEITHIEFPAADVERVAGFWNALFGWQFGESVMPDFEYRMARISDTAGVAVMPGETGHGNFYFDTDDIDASVAKVRELGGEAADKQPVPTHGWFAGCKDTEGNAFWLWQNDSNAG